MKSRKIGYASAEGASLQFKSVVARRRTKQLQLLRHKLHHIPNATTIQRWRNPQTHPYSFNIKHRTVAKLRPKVQVCNARALLHDVERIKSTLETQTAPYSTRHKIEASSHVTEQFNSGENQHARSYRLNMKHRTVLTLWPKEHVTNSRALLHDV